MNDSSMTKSYDNFNLHKIAIEDKKKNGTSYYNEGLVTETKAERALNSRCTNFTGPIRGNAGGTSGNLRNMAGEFNVSSGV